MSMKMFEPSEESEVKAMTNKERIEKYAKQLELVNSLDLHMTIDLMDSTDFKDRFKAEYFQTKIRYEKLNTMLIKMEAGTLGFAPLCPKEVLEDQLYYMNEYLKVLRIRAEIEGIDLGIK